MIEKWKRMIHSYEETNKAEEDEVKRLDEEDAQFKRKLMADDETAVPISAGEIRKIMKQLEGLTSANKRQKIGE
jgi:hypothetical protein